MLKIPLSALYYTDVVVGEGITAIYHGHCCICRYKLFDMIAQATQTSLIVVYLNCTLKVCLKPLRFTLWLTI